MCRHADFLCDELDSRLHVGEVAGALVGAQGLVQLGAQDQLHFQNGQLQTGQQLGAAEYAQEQAGEQLILLQHLELAKELTTDELLLVGEDVLLQGDPDVDNALNFAQNVVLLVEVGDGRLGLSKQVVVLRLLLREKVPQGRLPYLSDDACCQLVYCLYVQL